MRMWCRRWLILLTVLVSGACATARVANHEVRQRLMEANEALSGLQDRIERFYADLETLRQDLHVFYDKPGWSEMRQIILTVLSVESPDGADDGIEAVAEKVTEEWAVVGGEPWEDRFAEYLEMVRRCTALEARRLALQAELFGAQGKFLGMSAAHYSGGRYEQGKASDEVVELLSRSARELDSYSLDEVGLYEVP